MEWDTMLPCVCLSVPKDPISPSDYDTLERAKIAQTALLSQTSSRSRAVREKAIIIIMINVPLFDFYRKQMLRRTS